MGTSVHYVRAQKGGDDDKGDEDDEDEVEVRADWCTMGISQSEFQSPVSHHHNHVRGDDTTTTMSDDDHDSDWDEHTSWVALLDDEDDLTPVDRTSLVDRLGPVFAAHNRQGKEYIKHAFIPVLKHTKQLHDAIHNDIFPRRTHGLALFDDATLRFESAARRDMNAAQTVYDDTKACLSRPLLALLTLPLPTAFP
ncbi:hypothetical protein J3R82DRAFT_5749 [Butyriboletus roseoflavus]|nr:hypothetical protein J3R82DRAFT_5749 [Butyriboletus roseoflavus]